MKEKEVKEIIEIIEDGLLIIIYKDGSEDILPL
jgi:hypothetical protein